MTNISFKIQFVKDILDKETGALKSHLYFIMSDDEEALQTYADIKGYEPNQVSGLYPYFSSKFLGNIADIDYVCNEKYNDFYPGKLAKAYLKKKALIEQDARHCYPTNASAQLKYIAEESKNLTASTGSPFSWKSVKKQEETPAEDTPMDNF